MDWIPRVVRPDFTTHYPVLTIGPGYMHEPVWSGRGEGSGSWREDFYQNALKAKSRELAFTIYDDQWLA